jgi:hypothetical protein
MQTIMHDSARPTHAWTCIGGHEQAYNSQHAQMRTQPRDIPIDYSNFHLGTHELRYIRAVSEVQHESVIKTIIHRLHVGLEIFTPLFR